MAWEWTMEFVSNSPEALERMAAEPFDVVVTDMHMPGMDGAQLLQEVQKRHPETVRFVLSGQSSREAVLRFIGRSHQFLSKPCDIKELKGRIAAAFLLRDLLGSATVKEVISRLTSLPSMPALYDEIMAELESNDPSAARVVRQRSLRISVMIRDASTHGWSMPWQIWSQKGPRWNYARCRSPS